MHARLYGASRDTLSRIVLEQREAPARQEAPLARQQAMIAALQATNAQLAGGTVKHTRDVNARPFSADAQGGATLA